MREGLLPELRHGRRRPAAQAEDGAGQRRRRMPPLPEPALPSIARARTASLVTGIGGTGVVTIGALLGMAAHLEGKGVTVLDIDRPRAEGRRRDVPRADRRHARRTSTRRASHGRSRPRDRLRLRSSPPATNAVADASRPHPCRAEQRTHADRGVRQEPELAVPGAAAPRPTIARARATTASTRSTPNTRGRGCSATRSTRIRSCSATPGSGLGAADACVADARDRAERRAGREQQARPSNGAGAPRTTSAAVRKSRRSQGRRPRPTRRAARSFAAHAKALDELIDKRASYLTGYQNDAYADAVPRARVDRCARPRRRSIRSTASAV